MSCQDLRHYLPDLLDGALPEGLVRQLQGHVSRCKDCRVLVSSASDTITNYFLVDDEPPSLRPCAANS